MNEQDCTTYQEHLLGLLEGDLEPSVETDVREHMGRCPTCQREYRWLASACAGLEALGEEWSRQAPPVDLVDGVMDMVARVKEIRPQPVPFSPAPARRSMPWTGWLSLTAGLAAAAVIVWIASLSFFPAANQPKPGQHARATVTPDKFHRPTHVASNGKSRMSQTALQDMQTLFDAKRGSMEHKAPQPPDPSQEMARTKEPTLAELLELRKQAIDSPDARTRLSLWATLTDAKARELAKDSGVSIDAKVGLIDSLPPEEAESVLMAAIESYPNDPYLRKELADLYSAQPGSEAKAAAQLQELGRIDPTNAYSSFKTASNMFTQGDVEAARLALEQARAQERVDTYTSAAAKHYELALEASGAKSDVAQTATALSAGTAEYAEAVNLGTALLEAGASLEQSGDSTLAMEVLGAVQSLGEMIVSNAAYSAEWLAGLDIQSAAITAQSETSAAQSSAETLSGLAEQMQELVAAYNDLAAFYRTLDQFFSGSVSETLFTLLAAIILQSGDLNALEQLNQ